MLITAGHMILLLMVIGLFLLLLLVLLKFFQGGWREVPKVETQKSRQTAVNALLEEAKKGILQKCQHVPIYQQKAIEDIFAEMKFIFSEDEADQKIACGSIMKRLHDFKMEGEEFAELHQLIYGVLLQNKLGHMAEMFEKVYGCKQPEGK